jgi:hypothetical protein
MINPFQNLIDQGRITDEMVKILVQNLDEALGRKFGEIHIKIDHAVISDISFVHKVPREEIQRANKK